MNPYWRKSKHAQNFERWGKLVGAASGQLLDVFPLLRKVPPSVLPAYREAYRLAADEADLYTKNWATAKSRILSKTCHVRLSC